MATAGDYELPQEVLGTLGEQIANSILGANPRPNGLEAGKVEAHGSVWRLHFEVGKTPTEKELLDLLPAGLKATMVVGPGEIPSLITPQNEGGK